MDTESCKISTISSTVKLLLSLSLPLSSSLSPSSSLLLSPSLSLFLSVPLHLSPLFFYSLSISDFQRLCSSLICHFLFNISNFNGGLHICITYIWPILKKINIGNNGYYKNTCASIVSICNSSSKVLFWNSSQVEPSWVKLSWGESSSN